MPKHKNPDHAQGAASGHRTENKMGGPGQEPQFDEDSLYETGAYTNGILGI